MIYRCEGECKLLVTLFPSYFSPGTIITCQLDIDNYKSSCKFSRGIRCDPLSSSCGFPALVVVRGQDDCNAVEVVIANPSVVTEDMISVYDLIKNISFKPSLLDRIDIDAL